MKLKATCFPAKLKGIDYPANFKLPPYKMYTAEVPEGMPKELYYSFANRMKNAYYLGLNYQIEHLGKNYPLEWSIITNYDERL